MPDKPQLTLVAAMDESRLIATSKRIPWHLSRDIAHYRAYTLHKWLLLGRRTYEEMLGWFKPGHMPLVFTRREDWTPPLGKRVSGVQEALDLVAAAGEKELVCVGGAQVFELALPVADRLVLTLIQHRFPPDVGAVYFPDWALHAWETEDDQFFPADAENAFAMRFLTLRRRSAQT
jgi:dihydrofolate reductase